MYSNETCKRCFLTAKGVFLLRYSNIASSSINLLNWWEDLIKAVFHPKRLEYYLEHHDYDIFDY